MSCATCRYYLCLCIAASDTVVSCVWSCLSCDGAHRDLHVLTHSVPTRRSSDLRQALFSLHGQLCCHRPERQSMRTETASRTPLWPASIIPASAFRSQCSARLVSAAPVARVRAASRLSPARTRTPIPSIVGFRSITASLPVASTVVTARVSILPTRAISDLQGPLISTWVDLP